VGGCWQRFSFCSKLEAVSPHQCDWWLISLETASSRALGDCHWENAAWTGWCEGVKPRPRCAIRLSVSTSLTLADRSNVRHCHGNVTLVHTDLNDQIDRLCVALSCGISRTHWQISLVYARAVACCRLLGWVALCPEVVKMAPDGPLTDNFIRVAYSVVVQTKQTQSKWKSIHSLGAEYLVIYSRTIRCSLFLNFSFAYCTDNRNILDLDCKAGEIGLFSGTVLNVWKHIFERKHRK